MLAKQIFGSRSHRLDIKQLVRPGHPPRQNCRANGSRQNNISIAACASAKTRMKAWRDFLSPGHDNASGKIRVHPAYPTVKRSPRRAVKMNDLPGRMHAGIRSPGCHHASGVVGYCPKRPLDCFLYRLDTGLHLPAAELASIIFNTQGVARHRSVSLEEPSKCLPHGEVELPCLHPILPWRPATTIGFEIVTHHIQVTARQVYGITSLSHGSP